MKNVSRLSVILLLLGGVTFTIAAEKASELPLGLPKIFHPKDNKPSEAKINLGKQLYFDKRLSRENDISCASCHDPKKGWSNGDQFATGFQGKKGGRNSPTVLNSAYYRTQFWDGRAASLEEQALGPIANPIEMNLTLEEAVDRLKGIEGYVSQFQDVFGTEPNADGIAKAIAAYERTVLSGNAPYDQFKKGDKTALSDAAQRGMKLFFGKANCSACHGGANFTDTAFHNIGVGVVDGKLTDSGRVAISKLEGDTGAFKTPTLREIARTAPYMHDGSMKTLEEVVEHYNKGGLVNDYLDEEIFELNLSKEEIADLVTFMKEGLASEDYPDHEAPELP